MVEERRRSALHRAAAASWGEEVADTLVELVAPSGHELATRRDIQEVLASIAALEERRQADLAALREQLHAMDQRWGERLAATDERWGQQLEATEHRLSASFERGISAAVSMQTRTLVFSQLGALVVIAALAFGLR